ncbi:DUF1501 domain-containing protein [Singulisphaera sp. Ch08]|uniref:DUF1501 domain-containing protein n=1 Tax=Singulisphaera sp. Ch08 TaxID=3120278 RepID=A0AAU7CLZ3_9BACT
MLNIGGGARGKYCDGVSRRDFLKIGGLALGGLSLPGILRAEAQASIASSNKAIIMVFLAGGPPHQDMFDLKMNAPAEIRGEYRPIATNVPGLEICEHMPRLATMMDKVAVIRTMVGAHGDHSAGQCLTGYTDTISKVQGGRPSLGAILSKLRGPVEPSVPPFVGLSPKTSHQPWSNPGEPGYLGMAHSPFSPFRAEAVASAEPTFNLDQGRLGGRRTLLGELDSLRRHLESDEAIGGLDSFTHRAFDILSSGKLFQALDVTREDPKLRAKYGYGDMTNEADGPPCCNDQFLMARRLVEAGARCVTISFGRWDTHSDNFASCAQRIPKLDAALSTLIEDLHMRGLDKDVSVVVWGEFGRTPKINKAAGRDHWPQVSFALLAGGGMRTGQVIGSTDRNGEGPRDRPVTFQSVFATLYHNLGIAPDTSVPDRNGRPMYLLDNFEPIREVI